MTKLTGKNPPWQWSTECQEAFDGKHRWQIRSEANLDTRIFAYLIFKSRYDGNTSTIRISNNIFINIV